MYMKQVILCWFIFSEIGGFLGYGYFSATHSLCCKFSLQNTLKDTYPL